MFIGHVYRGKGGNGGILSGRRWIRFHSADGNRQTRIGILRKSEKRKKSESESERTNQDRRDE